MSDFKTLKLNPLILESIEAKGYSKPTPIQAKAIPLLIQGKDVLGIAQTGTGKTASFSLPIINRLIEIEDDLMPNQIHALILAPTRELATQIHNNIISYSSNLDLTTAVIMGGVRKENQIELMKTGIDIVVATPGRFMDLMSGGHILLDRLEIFVLDEADMMLDMGFLEDVKTVTRNLPEARQTVMFSATMPREIEKLAKSILKDPVTAAVAKQSTTIENVDQSVFFTLEDDKLQILLMLLEDSKTDKVIVFCKAKYSVKSIVDTLTAAGISTGEIHSNRSQNERNQAIKEFTDGDIRVLVATDIASRGLDVKGVTHVINFNMPEDPTFYVHRIGRTGRAGQNGVAISLCAERDLALLRNVQKVIKMDIPVVLDQPFHHEYKPLPKKGKHKASSSSMRQRKRPSQAKAKARKKFLENL
jgi:ATP-dependent RNA helicase RhlE